MQKMLIVAAGGRAARRVAAALCARGESPRPLVRDAAKARAVLVDDRGAPLSAGRAEVSFSREDEESIRSLAGSWGNRLSSSRRLTGMSSPVSGGEHV
jgi:hypothetical protein